MISVSGRKLLGPLCGIDSGWIDRFQAFDGKDVRHAPVGQSDKGVHSRVQIEDFKG